MAYDEDLANRIRELLGGVEGVTDQKMFGGLGPELPNVTRGAK